MCCGPVPRGEGADRKFSRSLRPVFLYEEIPSKPYTFMSCLCRSKDDFTFVSSRQYNENHLQGFSPKAVSFALKSNWVSPFVHVPECCLFLVVYISKLSVGHTIHLSLNIFTPFVCAIWTAVCKKLLIRNAFLTCSLLISQSAANQLINIISLDSFYNIFCYCPDV